MKAVSMFLTDGRRMQRRAAIGLLAVGILSACGGGSAGDAVSERSSPVRQGSTLQVSLEVPGLDCAGCNLAIHQELMKISGVIEVNGNSDTGSAVIRYDPTKSRPEAFVRALKAIGFEATAEDPVVPAGESEGGER